MAFVTAALIAGGATLAAGAMQAGAAGRAAKAQADAANRSADLQYKQFKETTRLQEPFRQVGVNALPELVQASRYTPFSMDQFQQDPGYGFRLREGLNALDRTAAARGGMLGGNQLRGAVQYGQELGSQEYNNAFNRYQTERNARLNPLQALAGVGQTTTNQISQAGQNMATNVGNAYQNAADARASGYLGTANAFSNAVNTGLNFYQGQQYLKALQTPRT